MKTNNLLRAARARTRTIENRPPDGKVYLVGAGPGDPELITLKAMRILQQADVVLYDRLIHPDVLAIAERASWISVGKKPDMPGRIRQEEIHDLMIDYARSGATVVRLKGGDPFVFGRGGEEVMALRNASIACEVVPGISSAVAAPSWAGIPVTHRGIARGFGVFTAQSENEYNGIPWQAAAGLPAAVFLMGVKNLAIICEKLIEHGKDPETPVAIIERGTLQDGRTVLGTLQSIGEKALQLHKIKSPATIIVGDVVSFARPDNYGPAAMHTEALHHCVSAV